MTTVEGPGHRRLTAGDARGDSHARVRHGSDAARRTCSDRVSAGAHARLAREAVRVARAPGLAGGVISAVLAGAAGRGPEGTRRLTGAAVVAGRRRPAAAVARASGGDRCDEDEASHGREHYGEKPSCDERPSRWTLCKHGTLRPRWGTLMPRGRAAFRLVALFLDPERSR
jgi:hypothetical protein